MKYFFSALVALTLFSACSNSKKQSSANTDTESKQVERKLIPEDHIKRNYGDGIYAQFHITEGDVLVRLEEEKAPLTVANFVALAEGKMPNNAKPLGTPFYDGLTFHRVISLANGSPNDFMIQGGDPAGNGTGGPGYNFRDEFNPMLRHDKPGILSMANSGPNSNGSQFFITIVPTPHLDNIHSIFGHVVEGQKKVNRTLQGDKIKYVAIIRVGDRAQEFDAMATFNKLK